jgi:hypothetical protein
MSFTVQFLQQQQPVQAMPEAEAEAPCGLRRIGRTDKPPRRAVRIRACVPPPPPPAEVASLAVSAFVPYAGRSVIHKRFHANNVAAIGNMLALQKQAIEQTQQTAILRQQTEAQLKIATATEIIGRQQPNRPGPGTFDPALNHAKFSLIADVVAVAAHFMDKHEVDADSFLNDKLNLNTAPLIEEVHGLLVGYKLEEARKTFEAAVDGAVFERFVQSGELTSPAVYAEINRRAGYLLATMLLIAAEDFGIGIDPGDWPSPPYDDDGGVELQTAPIAAPAPTAPAKAASQKLAEKRAKKIAANKTATPRSKR